MVKEGYTFSAGPLLLGVAAVITGWKIAGGVLIFLALFVLYFFRDPERQIPGSDGDVVSPADGRVVVITEEAFNGRQGTRISIFLAVWNVHVQRAPLAGRIAEIEYRPGRFYAAMRARASEENEQNVFRLETPAGEIVFKQIAGWIARRVVSWKKEGDVVVRGERVGMIRFGSRVDLWLPAGAEIRVRKGQNVTGGSTVLARWP
jgi:phosphatidylserine decarboxylase